MRQRFGRVYRGFNHGTTHRQCYRWESFARRVDILMSAEEEKHHSSLKIGK